ncbi:MAG TPA: TonB-dependent receptor, partial [Geobacteraceae bacterium]|nr:TonB-dependent receptor [Geobacteraceae bacterium]
YYETDDLVVSATRNPKPLSQAAENITIVTAAEIEMMGAHTLVDVLANVSGIQVSDRGGPGLFNDFSIHGADVNQILVMLDGVTLNFFGNPFVDISGIPLQIIDRVEIVKGPGSSSWGSALGAVINIVTKSPLEGRNMGGTLSFSGGESGTRDSRGELSGTVGPIGYYLYAGNLRSDGLRPNSGVDQNDIYAKLRWDFPEKGSLLFSIAYDHGIAGVGDTLDKFDVLLGFRRRNFLSTLSFNYPITDKIDLDLSLHTTYKKTHQFVIVGEFAEVTARESSDGGSAKLTWREGINTLAVGADYDHLDSEYPWFHRFSDKYGVFLNDTLSLGDFGITPGIRYDRMRPVGDFFSPSLGVAWNPTDKVTLRAYWARGYSLPLLCPVRNPLPSQQKVTTVQAGVETTYIPWLWLKTTFFWNQLSDVQEQDPVNWWEIVLKKQLKQGVEMEGKTVPIFNTSLSAGYTFIDTKDRETGKTLRGVPRQLVKLGLHFDDNNSFRGTLLGRYGWLNSPAYLNGKYSAIIWDLNLAKRVFKRHDTAIELFFDGHNLFNGSQYSGQDDLKNARRWFEGGIRFNF